jgi:hypothetical protein
MAECAKLRRAPKLPWAPPSFMTSVGGRYGAVTGGPASSIARYRLRLAFGCQRDKSDCQPNQSLPCLYGDRSAGEVVTVHGTSHQPVG